MHTARHKKTLVARVRRVRGQVEALEQALEAERGCEEVVRIIAAARGAINPLAAEVLCDHLGAPRILTSARATAATELAQVIRQFVG